MFKFAITFMFLCKTCYGIEFTDLRYFGERVRNLSLELFYFTELENEGDVVMAPFTIWNQISLVAFKTSSDSWRQLHSVIGISKRNGQYFNSIFSFITDSMMNNTHLGGVSFKSKQIVFCDTNLELAQSFQIGIINSGVLLKMIDFEDNVAAAKEANDYIKLHSNAFSRMILMFKRTDFEESSMIMSSVVEFQGNWSLPFDKSNTILQNGNYIMQQKAQIKHVNINILGASATELNYGVIGEFSMVIFTPHDNTSVDDILINFDKITFADVLSKLSSEPLQVVDVKLPKFSSTSTLLLNGPLTSMEARDIFLSSQADFSGITEEDIYISAMEHRAIITVSETGTLANAYTPANIDKGSRTSLTTTTSPFLFFIVYRPSYAIVFCGKYGA